MQTPQTAELVFPSVDRALDDGNKATGKWKRSTDFVANYMDQRAQANYVCRVLSSLLNSRLTLVPKASDSPTLRLLCSPNSNLVGADWHDAEDAAASPSAAHRHVEWWACSRLA